MKIYAECNDHIFTFSLTEIGDDQIISTNGDEQKFTFLPLGQNRFSLIHNNKSHLVHIVKEDGLYHVHLDGNHFPFRVEDERTRALRELVQKSVQVSGDHEIKAPIPGLITKIKVKEGDKISAKDGLVILEAMKMENEIRAEFDGIVNKIMVNEGSPVEKDEALLIISTE